MSVWAAAALCLGPVGTEAADRVPRDGIITAPGAYRLAGDLTAGRPKVIEVRSDDVAIDLGGHTVRCDADDPERSVTFGVFAEARVNLRVRNGAITDCTFGLRSTDSEDTVVDRVDFTGNRYVGVDVTGTGARISGSTFVRLAGYRPRAYAIGINGVGSDAVIRGNVFRELYRQPEAQPEQPGEGVAIVVSTGNSGNTIRHNWIENTRAADNIGIWIAGEGEGHVVEENVITGMQRGIIVFGQTAVRIADNRIWLREADTLTAIFGERIEAEDNVIVNGDAVYLDVVGPREAGH